MSQFEKETLSALLDNEADDLELRRLLKSIERNPELAEIWERYCLEQSLMHNPATPVDSGLAARVQQQIQNEPALSVRGDSFSGWQQTFSKLAIAASVAVIFVFAFQGSFNNPVSPSLVEQEYSSLEQDALQPNASLVAESVSFEVDPEAQERLLEYIESMSFDEDKPVRVEPIQDSPLYRLVNELQAKP